MAQIETPRDAADAQTELKKRARRRLVGAAALALLAAIVLPMVMDHEPRQPVQDIQVRIPSQDAGGFTSRILPAKPAATPLPPAEAVAAAKPESAPAAKPEAKPEPKPESKPESKPEASKAETKPAEVPKATAAPAAAKPAAPAVPATKPAEKPAEAAHKAEEARAAAALAGAADSGQWVVQLGAYKESGNVKQLVTKLKDMGVPSYTEKFDSPQGPRTRVRAGPFASREAAERAQAKIKTIHVDGPVAQK